MPILKKHGTKWWTSLVLAALVACGCQAPTIPNPNDPDDVGLVSPDVLSANLASLQQFLVERMLKGEITRVQADKYMAEEGAKMVDHIKVKDIPQGLVSEYANIFRIANDWKKAKEAYEVAAKFAKNGEKKNIDTLRLAVCKAALGDAKEAIQISKKVVEEKDADMSSALTIVYMELVPRAKGQHEDRALADLLIEIVKKYKAVKIDPNSEGGLSQGLARAYHIQRALQAAYDLYSAAGDIAKAQACLKIEIPQYYPKLPSGLSRKEFIERFGGGHGNMRVPLMPPGSGDFRPGAPGMELPTK